MSKTRPKKTRRGRPADAERDAHIDAILDAATEVFLEQGYEAASTAEIARRAGASKTTLYARFPTKAELFTGLLERRNTQLRARASEITLNFDAPPEETLTRYGLLVFRSRMDEQSRKLLSLFLSEKRRFPALSEKAWEEGPAAGERMVANYLHHLNDQGVLNVPDVSLAARQFMGALIGWELLRSCFSLAGPLENRAAMESGIRDTVRRFLSSYEKVKLGLSALRRLKGYRRTFSRFEKLDVVFLGFLAFAFIVEALR